MHMQLDGNGLAVVIGAVVAGVVSLGTLSMQVVTFLDTRKLKMMSAARDVQIAKVKELVNGQSEKLLTYAAKDAYEKGREHERVAPGTASPEVSVVKQPTITTAIMIPTVEEK